MTIYFHFTGGMLSVVHAVARESSSELTTASEEGVDVDVDVDALVPVAVSIDKDDDEGNSRA